MFPILAGNSAATGYNLTRSLRFRRLASGYLSKAAFATSSTNESVRTISFWAKLGSFVSSSIFTSTDRTDYYDNLSLNSSSQLVYNHNYNNSNTTFTSNAVYRDPASWYHVVVVYNSPNATAASRVLVYVNGIQLTGTWSGNITQTQSQRCFSLASASAFGYPVVGALSYFDGYLAEVNFIDGQALTPSSFGSTDATTGVWQPARYTGTYGTNGFYLPFTDNSALTTSSNVGLGKDFSGNGNYWTTNNISLTAGVTYDSMTDVPTLTSATAANYCVLNAVNQPTSTTLNDGNLKIVATTPSYRLTQSTFTLTSGKYYFEMTKLTAAQYVNGLALVLPTLSKDTSTLNQAGVYAVTHGNPNQITSYTNGGGSVLIGTVDWANNDIIQCAFDATTGKIWFGRNGTYYPATNGGTIGDPAAGTNQTVTGVSGLTPTVISYDTSSSCAINFGQRPFSYTPPSGFLSLNTFNLPTSTIVKGNTVMDATTYSGNSTAGTNIANAAAFKPDFVWIKNRSAANNNILTDSIRGATKTLYSDLTNAEGTLTGALTAFNSNGFQVGYDGSPIVNASANNYVGWQWQAGQGSSSSNTNGSITSTVSVNASAGFSVVTWAYNSSGGTLGHGLGVAPQLIIQKDRTNGTYSWDVYHASLGATQRLSLNSTNATQSQIVWNNTAPTSSVFSSGASWYTNADAIVSYCWTPIAGYSSFGSYLGNGSADGPFVYTGFRPKFLLLKESSASSNNWFILDTTRDPYNVAPDYLQPNTSIAENAYSSPGGIDFLSNGFKLRTSSTSINTSGSTIIYAAFAENPFKNSLAR